jgi:hypothetical protein
MNNTERTNWINNDEGLYNMFIRSHSSMRKFIQENKDFIDGAINNILNGKKPAHYLAYHYKVVMPFPK